MARFEQVNKGATRCGTATRDLLTAGVTRCMRASNLPAPHSHQLVVACGLGVCALTWTNPPDGRLYDARCTAPRSRCRRASTTTLVNLVLGSVVVLTLSATVIPFARSARSRP